MLAVGALKYGGLSCSGSKQFQECHSRTSSLLGLVDERRQAQPHFFGDKVLGAAVALAQRGAVTHSAGDLTRLQSLATSNHFIMSHLWSILPDHTSSIPRNVIQAHAAGTMVEAAVAAVHAQGDERAVADLAVWLVHTARILQSGWCIQLEMT